MFPLVIVAFIVSAVSGRKFQNPVLDGSSGFLRPGVLLHGDQYYAVTSTLISESEQFPIHVSSDLQNWQKAGYALPKGYVPDWTAPGYFSPEIHQIGENDFRLFFFALDRASNRYDIAVGVSQTVLGPYEVQKRPLQFTVNESTSDPTLVQDGVRKYLVWEGYGGVFGRELTADCLDFIPGSVPKLILSGDLAWEEKAVAGPWYVRRPDGWYMFYSGNRECTDRYAVGVARSRNPLGPFEKRGDPILVSNDDFKGPGQVSVVPDNGSTVMVYEATKSLKDMCTTNGTAVLSQTVEWGDDGWPFMNPN